MMSELAIETTGLTRAFGNVLAVDHVNLQVPEGSVYGYLGRNGAGKTTTIQMLMGMLQPDIGSMRVMGFDPLREDVAMKRVVSYVPERVHMPEWMTVGHLMGFGKGVHPRWDGKLAEALRERLELPAERKLGQLSRGMQGKAALLSALASRPRLLILDDPTMGLDALVRREFMESIVGALSDTGTTVFFSSHILEDVERVADVIGILHEGKLVVQAPLEELKGAVRRVIATFPEATKVELPGVLQHSDEGRQQVWVVRNYDVGILQALHDAGALSAEVEHCSLEDIFVAFVRTGKAA